MRAAATVIVVLAATVVAGPRKQAAPAELEGAEALATFTKALEAQRAQKADHPLRIAYFGDSLTADDQITHALRTRLGAVLGEGGPGFVFAASPHPYNQHRAVTRVVGGRWRVHGVSSAVPGDHLLGLGGSAESEGGGTLRFTTATKVHALDVHYLAQPRGGSFEVLAGGSSVATIATAAEKKQAAFAQISLPDGATRIELRAKGRVRLFGASLEARRGVVVDNLGVVNATAKQLATHNLAEHWRKQLAHRAADLVVVMLGTNEAEWLPPKGTALDEHEALFGELLASIRASGSPCLVVSPLDQLDWRAEGQPPRASIPAMVEAQRRAAKANGCAFWDTYAWMGGKGASRDWHRRGLVTKDYQHPTTAGATRLADALYRALIR